MRAAEAARNHRAVGDRAVARLEIELARGVEPMTGSVRAVDTPARPFTGVLELIALLDEARAEEPATGPPPR